MVTYAPALELEEVSDLVSQVVDPEIPVLTVSDLGILRGVSIEGARVVVTITPTYSGCPAMGQIEDDVRSTLAAAGFDDVDVVTRHHPAWTSDWITAEGHEKLARFGIAPPVPAGDILCPRCAASAPRMVARFGSTACKALMVCSSCNEPFDYFKVF